MTGSYRWFSAFAVALGAALVALFHSAAQADVLVLDVCMEKCNEADWLAIHNMRLALESEVKNGALIASVDRMVGRLGNKVPLPGIDDPLLTVETLTRHIKDGINQWTGGDYEQAAKGLKVALTEATMNPAIVVADSTLRPLIQRAYVARAVSLFRLDRKDEAKEAIADLVRMTPQPSILDTWGTIPDKVFQLSRNDLLARGTGSLSLQVNDPSAVFYLNAASQPYRGSFAAEMLPGVYQIFVTDTAKRSRRYRVEVTPHEHTVLNIDWRRDSKFDVSMSRSASAGEPSSTRRPRIGFTFSSLSERRFETEYASGIAAQVPGSLVVVVGRIRWDNKDMMIGAMYAPDPQPLRIGMVADNSLDSARELATFLMTNRPAPLVTQLAVPPWEHAPATQSGRALSGSSRWVIIGTGVAAIATGAGLYAIDRDGRRTSAYGIGIGVAGLVTAGVGLWFGRAPGAGPVVSVSSAHAMVGWASTF